MHHAARTEPPRQPRPLLEGEGDIGIVHLGEHGHRIRRSDAPHTIEIGAQRDRELTTETGQARVWHGGAERDDRYAGRGGLDRPSRQGSAQAQKRHMSGLSPPRLDPDQCCSCDGNTSLTKLPRAAVTAPRPTGGAGSLQSIRSVPRPPSAS